MLHAFGFKNYFSFKEGAEISLAFDKNTPDAISQGLRHGTALGIKGANASGKTQVLKALNFIEYFCLSSFRSEPDSQFAFNTHFDSEEPTDFFIEFSTNSSGYRYEFTLKNDRVLKETIYRIKNRSKKIIERTENDITYCLDEFQKVKTIKLRKNVSLLSSIRQYELDMLEDAIEFFSLFQSNVFSIGMRETPLSIERVATFIHDKKEIIDFISSTIKRCDTGVSEIRILKNEAKGKSSDADQYFPVFVHVNNDEKSKWITEWDESSGTKNLFRMLFQIKMAIDTGGVLVVDEFGTHLHPDLLPLLLEIFIESTSNPRNAQIILSTHDERIMDLLGRYRTYLVNKENNESYMYRLDEITGDILRNDRLISTSYTARKIGGVPNI